VVGNLARAEVGTNEKERQVMCNGKQLTGMRCYWRLLEITVEVTGDYWRLLESTGDYWRLL